MPSTSKLSSQKPHCFIFVFAVLSVKNTYWRWMIREWYKIHVHQLGLAEMNRQIKFGLITTSSFVLVSNTNILAFTYPVGPRKMLTQVLIFVSSSILNFRINLHLHHFWSSCRVSFSIITVR